MHRVEMVKDKPLTLRGVTCASIGISLLLCIFTFMPPRFPSKSTLHIGAQVNPLQCESYETVDLLKKQVIELNQKLEALMQEMNQTKMAGPFGTVKGKINPTVYPTETPNPKLAKILSKIAINRELIVVLANSNVHPLLQIQFDSIKRVGISNYLVVALDNQTIHLCESNDVAFYKWDMDSAAQSSSGSVVSALKFRILREFLELSYNVLLTDTDVLFLQNPFHHLYRDSDVESMSDGYDAWAAYGYNHIFDDPDMMWSRFVYTTRIWALNSGFFYIRATLPAIELLDRVRASLIERPHAWDQAVYNEELLFPSHLDYVGLNAAKRVMDIYLFMNSNVLFRSVRKDPVLRKRKPIVVHINYHPDKLSRMMATVEFYVNGKENALDPFTDGTVRT